MKGIIFNIAEAFIRTEYGDEAYDKIVSHSSFQTNEPFVGPGTYPDSDFLEMVGKAISELGLEPAIFLKKFGHFAFFKLAERHPNFLSGMEHPKDFLKTVNDVVHVEVRKLYSQAYLPTFTYADPSEDELVITYHSKRKLYPFMEGLIDGVATYFKTPILQEQVIYQKNGEEFCDFKLKFEHGFKRKGS